MDPSNYYEGPATAFSPRDEVQTASALESLASTLDDIELRLRKSGAHANAIADRVFAGPRPVNTAMGKGEAPREPASIPALHNRLERIHAAIGELDGALGTLAGL